MKVTLKVDIEVNAHWFRSAVDVAGVPGRFDEAKAELDKRVAESVSAWLQKCGWLADGSWLWARVEPLQVRKVRRIASGNRVKR